jgi:hypothetical protein
MALRPCSDGKANGVADEKAERLGGASRARRRLRVARAGNLRDRALDTRWCVLTQGSAALSAPPPSSAGFPAAAGSVSLDELLVTIRQEWAKLGPLIDLECMEMKQSATGKMKTPYLAIGR